MADGRNKAMICESTAHRVYWICEGRPSCVIPGRCAYEFRRGDSVLVKGGGVPSSRSCIVYLSASAHTAPQATRGVGGETIPRRVSCVHVPDID